MKDKITPYYPVFSRLPNKLIRYEERPFDDGYGHYATVVVAIFTDKNKSIQEMDAQVKWRNKWKEN